MKKLAVIMLFVVIISGCGSLAPVPLSSPPLTFPAITLPSVQVGTAYTATIIAAGGVSPYTWSVTSGALPAGVTLGSSTGVISGTPTAVGTFTFTATVADSSAPPLTKANSLSITVTPPPLALLTTSLPGAVAAQAYATTLQASGGTPPLTWTVTGSTPPAGLTLSTAGVLSGTPTAVGTTPFTVTVTDSGTPVQTKSGILNLAVAAAVACGSGSESLLTGQYAFKVAGFNDTGYVAVVGSFTADGKGAITAGEADMNSGLGAQTGNIVTASSSYSVGADHRGCATIATAFGTFTTRFALGAITSSVATKGRIIEFEPVGATAFIGTGQIMQQTASAFTAGLNGAYTSLLTGWDGGLPGRIACAGAITAAGTGAAGGTLTNGVVDCNDSGAMTNTTAVTGTYSSVDTNGRTTEVTGLGDVTAYIVSSSQLLSLATSANPILSGEARLQVAPTGGYTVASLTGTGVIYANGVNDATSSKVQIGITTADGVSSLTASIYENDGGVWATTNPTLATCTYAVATNGRVTTSGAGCGGAPPILYLWNANTAFLLGTDAGVLAGNAVAQTGTLSASTVAGTYYFGTTEVISQAASSETAMATLTSGGAVNIISDTASIASQSADLVSTGVFAITSKGTFTTGNSAGAIVGLAISSNQFVLINGFTGSYPTIVLAGQ